MPARRASGGLMNADPKTQLTPLPSSGAMDRYRVYGRIGAGGMATVHLGRVVGPAGFSRAVAIKRIRAENSSDPDVIATLFDEARLASRIQHPNVVSVIDVVQEDNGGAIGITLIMDYVRGAALSQLQRQVVARGETIPVGIALRILAQTLYGLQAAHEATGEQGEHLGVIHRDISPQNILVGVDGVTRITDFGIAKAASRVQTTQDGTVKGKLGYVAPEQLSNSPVDARLDVYSASVVCWEALTGQRLFQRDGHAEIIASVLTGSIPAPSSVNPSVSPELDAIVLKGLARNPADRFDTALDMAEALEHLGGHATQREVSKFVEREARDHLAEVDLVKAEHSELSASRPVRTPTRTPLSPGVAPVTPADSLTESNEPTRVSEPSGTSRTGTTEAGLATELASEAHTPPQSRIRLTTVSLGAGICIALGLSAYAVYGGGRQSPATATGAGRAVDPVAARAASPSPPPAKLPAEKRPIASEPGSKVLDESAAAARDNPLPAAEPDPAEELASPVAARPQESSAAPSLSNRPDIKSRPAVARKRKLGHPPPTRETAAMTEGKPISEPKGKAETPNCNPNYTIDESGLKTFKPECFK